MTGVIKTLHAEKGFAFVRGDDGHEYFLHRSACRNVDFNDLEIGQQVRFTESASPKGPRAEDVSV